MRDVLAIVFNDIHLKDGNEDEVYKSTVHMVNYAVENKIKNLIFAGDLFDSRSYQRQKQLTTLDKMLDLFHKIDKTSNTNNSNKTINNT